MDTVTVPSASAVQEPRGALEIYRAQRLERLFDACFGGRWRTKLVGGASEPYYQPASGPRDCHRLYYRSDYFASALHEISHWCIAGEQRLQQPDFGYWYAPEGRDGAQQLAFEAVEAKPQALEWLFSLACGYRFCISVDNFGAPDGEPHDTLPFKRQVLEQSRRWQSRGLPPRAQVFFNALCLDFDTGVQLPELELTISGLVG